MDLQNIINKLKNSAFDNATPLAALVAFLGRMAESNIPLEEAIKFIPYELQKSFSSLDDFTWKLYRAPHVGQSIFKLSAIVWGIGQFVDIIPKQYVNAAGKAMVGATIGNIAIRGSTPTPTGFSQASSPNANMIDLWKRYG